MTSDDGVLMVKLPGLGKARPATRSHRLCHRLQGRLQGWALIMMGHSEHIEAPSESDSGVQATLESGAELRCLVADALEKRLLDGGVGRSWSIFGRIQVSAVYSCTALNWIG